MEEAIFFENRDNNATITIYNDGVVVSPSEITKLEFVYFGGSVDSVSSPSLFVFGSSSILLLFGKLDIAPGIYSMKMIVYHQDYTSGIVWDSNITMRFGAA